jgi:hypothetical protein
VLVADARNDGSYLRTTWHADRRTFVVSTWNDEVCTAAVRVPVEEAAALVGLLVDGLAEAATTPLTDDSALEQRRSRHRGVLTLRRDVQAWVRHTRRVLGALISGTGREDQQSRSRPPASRPEPEEPEQVRWTA